MVQKKLRILYGGNKYYNYDQNQGFSFEHANVYDSLMHLPNVEIIYFVYDQVRQMSKENFNKKLLDLVMTERPDVFVSIMYNEDLTFDTLLNIKKICPTIGIFMDDHWHLYNSKIVAPYLSWIVTTYSKAVEEYQKIGCKNVLHYHLGANHWAFYPEVGKEKIEKKYDVSFVGAWFINREKIVNSLQKAGISVVAWGPGWPNGRLADDQMLSLVHQTKINIDINPPSSHIGFKPLARFFFKRQNSRVVLDVKNFFDNVNEWYHKKIPMIKPRTFNCLAAKSFVITQMTHDLPEYYKIDKEIVSFTSLPELIDKIKYYLKNPKERELIAEAGYERTINNHTYEKRFLNIFKKIGLL